MTPELQTWCIVLPMQMKMEHERCERFVEDAAELAKLRSQCLRFVQDHAEAIKTAGLLVQGLNSMDDKPWGDVPLLRGATARQGNGKRDHRGLAGGATRAARD